MHLVGFYYKNRPTHLIQTACYQTLIFPFHFYDEKLISSVSVSLIGSSRSAIGQDAFSVQVAP